MGALVLQKAFADCLIYKFALRSFRLIISETIRFLEHTCRTQICISFFCSTSAQNIFGSYKLASYGQDASRNGYMSSQIHC